MPVVAQKLGSGAGIFLLFPVVTLLGLLFLGLDQGLPAVSGAARAGMYAIPTVLAFLAGVYFTSSRGMTLTLALGVGLRCWLLAAVTVWAVAPTA